MGEGAELPLPELEDGHHIIEALMEAGPVAYGGMGLAPLSWREINAWQAATASPLRPHELQLLRRLSSVYLDQYEKARQESCPSPEVMRAEGDKAKRLVPHIKNVLRG